MVRRGEFALIETLFAPLTRGDSRALGLADDAAVLGTEGLGDLVVSVDGLVSGVHFLPDDPPGTIAAKCLRVNLSDMAAMGAKPVAAFLSACLSPTLDDRWLEAFTEGLRADLQTYSFSLLGGDTTSTPGPASFSITILGSVAPGAALRRSGARMGDDLWVSGTVGDGALGLRVLQGPLFGLPEVHRMHLIDRYRKPQPRVALGLMLSGGTEEKSGRLATACMDISDGLLADAAHVAKASDVALEIWAPDLPLSEAAADLVADDPTLFDLVLGGGDDYELLFTAPPENREAILAAGQGTDTLVTRLGRVVEGAGARILDIDGVEIALAKPGWSHDG
ncbi:thiamine-phosphate kinase [Rhodospirillum sp. A1_3_36]|uniref:thiamine-phosphate kinase n=1 Tax=Rhodospirillum sp. A1_3_36 TaxID=3391666 RepID=UPI0039A62E8B